MSQALGVIRRKRVHGVPAAIDPYMLLVVADGASGYWRLGEGAGSKTARATVGPAGQYSAIESFGESGAIQGSADTAVKFDGSQSGGSVVAVESDFNFASPNDAFTLEAWVDPDTLIANAGRIIRRLASGYGYRLWYDTAGVHLQRMTPSGTFTASYLTPLDVDAGYYYIVGTYSGSELRLYVNGGLAAGPVADLSDMPVAAGAFTIGGGPVGTMDGALDEVAVYPLALSAAKIAEHYTYGGAVTPPAASYADTIIGDTPVGYWRLEEATGTDAAPAVGTVHGTYADVALGAAGLIVDGGYAPVFNGDADGSGGSSLDLGDNFGFDGTDPFTVEAWVEPTTLDTVFRRIASKEKQVSGGGTGNGKFGKQTDGTSADQWGGNQKLVSKFWALAGSVTKLTGRVDGLGAGGSGSMTCRAVMYADNAGSPGALLGVSSTVVTITAGDQPAWKDFSFASPVTVSAGAIWLGFWLSYQSGAPLFEARHTGVTGNARYNANSYSTTENPADPFGTATTTNHSFAIYATLAETGVSFFGVTEVEGDSPDTAQQQKGVNMVTAPACTVTKIRGYLTGQNPGGSGTQPIRAVIYANSSGSPGALLGVSSEVVIAAGQPPGWVEFSFGAGVSVSAGSIWIGYWAGAASGSSLIEYRYTASTNALKYNTNTYHPTNNPTDPFGSASTASLAYSIYAVYTAGGSSTGGGWHVSATSSKVQFSRIDTNGVEDAITTGTVPLTVNGIAHVVAVFDGAAGHIYVNGADKTVGGNASTRSIPVITDHCRIGQRSYDLARTWAGTIDEVAIYDRALTAAEVAEHHLLGAGEGPPPPPPPPTGDTYVNQDIIQGGLVSMSSSGTSDTLYGASGPPVLQYQTPNNFWAGLLFTNTDDVAIVTDAKYGKVYRHRCRPSGPNGYSRNPYWTDTTNSVLCSGMSGPAGRTNRLEQWDWYLIIAQFETGYTADMVWGTFFQFNYPTIASPPLHLGMRASGGVGKVYVGRFAGYITPSKSPQYLESVDLLNMSAIVGKYVEYLVGVKWSNRGTGEIHIETRCQANGETEFTERFTRTPGMTGVPGPGYTYQWGGPSGVGQDAVIDTLDKQDQYFGYFTAPGDWGRFPANNYIKQVGYRRCSDRQTALSYAI